ncbi:MAG: polyphosphate kinase 1 [Bacteroidales bacterium]|nr:polyphosphate kinase 1 [Bacteroidales bacterium]
MNSDNISPRFINREISWLSFNHRVLQEAADETNPLIQRMRFLGIFSNNRDEFFRIRVATVRRLASFSAKKKLLGNETPHELLHEIQNIVVKQQSKFERIYMNLLKEMEQYNIYVVNETQLTAEQGRYVLSFYNERIRPILVPIILQYTREFPYLRDEPIYFAVKLSKQNRSGKTRYALLDLATEILPRFVVLPKAGEKKYIIILDDIVRYCLNDIFSFFDYDKAEAYTIKITRDAELDIDDDISKSFMEKMSLSLEKRKRGQPVRFVYDASMPEDLLSYFQRRMRLGREDNIIAGGRYHNFKDFINFPNIGPSHLENKVKPPVPAMYFEHHKSILEKIKERDHILHYPYQSFRYYIDMLREAAIDPRVTAIQITLYRVAPESVVINSLINAAKNGKKVVVVIELQARFDEQANISWSSRLQEVGAKVIHGVPGLKVHCKLTLIERKINKRIEHFAYIGTGNFHEETSKIYCDEGLFTSDKRITSDVVKVFEFFDKNYKQHIFNHIILSPFSTRRHFLYHIDHEIKNAKRGKKAYMIIKMNSLVDEEMMEKLYEASQAGVIIKLIIRSICSLKPGVPGLSDNIEAISIVDKFLEHSRIFYFYHGGNEKVYISSADWMVRNLDRRIEVTCPVYDPEIKRELKKMLRIQLRDNVKARIIDDVQDNKYVRDENKKVIRAQDAYYFYLKRRRSQIENLKKKYK